jgi:PKHD-type hydroxylase
VSLWLFKLNEVEPFTYINDVFSKEQCEQIIQIGKDIGLKESRVGKESKIDTEWRKSKNNWLTVEGGHDWIFRDLTFASTFMNDKHFKFDLIGFAEGIQFAEYNAPDGGYGSHTDNIFGGLTRKLSISVQLSDESSYEGGDLCLNYGNEIIMPRKQGTVIAFPSPTLHRVAPVTKGTRHSLVGWITGPQFK